MFKLNEKVVYPGHGVALVESIVEKEVAGDSLKFFKLRFLFKDMTVLVPLHNLASTGVRYPSDEKAIEKTLSDLIDPPKKRLENLDLSPSGWNKRNKEYQLLIQSGHLEEIARIYRDLMHISLQKDLSFGEKNLLQATEELLVQEITTVKNIERATLLQQLRSPFKQFFTANQDSPQQTTSV